MIIVEIYEKEEDSSVKYPGEPTIMVVRLEDDFGNEIEIEAADTWLNAQELSVGDVWPEEPDNSMEAVTNLSKQAEWMEQYLEALEDLEE